MLLATLFSSIFFLTSPLLPPSSIETLQQHHLDMRQGQIVFLAHKLTPFLVETDRLNDEVTALSRSIQQLSAEKDHKQILDITMKVIAKMEVLKKRLVVLKLAESVDSDFQHIDALMRALDAPTPEQLQALDRLTSLCRALETVE